MLDLMNIARTEADGGDLQGLLAGLFEPSDVRPTGYPHAVIWQGGNHDGKVKPVAHSDVVPVFVLNTRFANKDHLKNALEVFETNKVKNFGFILNGVRMKKSKYYYNTNYGYGYRYAYGYGQRKVDKINDNKMG